MTAPLDRRKIEAVIVEELRREGWSVIYPADTIAYKRDEKINITKLAHDLADELTPP